MRKSYKFGKFGITYYPIPKRERTWRIIYWTGGRGHRCIDFFLGRHLYAFWHDSRDR